MNRLLIMQLLGAWAALGQVDVLTANYNNSRTSANLEEHVLSPETVSPATFGKLASLPVAGQIYAQPLVATSIDVPACGTCDVVYVATMENNVYAFNATTLDTVPLWKVNLGPPVPASLVNFRAIDPSIGILGTPVINRGRQAIYILSETLRGGAPVFRLHALDLATGAEILNGPTDVNASVKGTGDGSVNGSVRLDPMLHIQRPGLLTANGRLYIAFGSIFDRTPYHGWVLSYDLNQVSQQLDVFNSTPDGGAGGIWQSGRGLVADDLGNIYLGTGNGDYDGLRDFGESFLRLSPDLEVVDWFTPADWQERSDVDLDTASLGPILIPSLNMILGGDKDNNGYLINQWNMGHLGMTGASLPQVFQPIGYGGLFNAAVWDRPDGPLAYFVEEGAATLVWRIGPARRFEASPFSITDVTSDYPWQGLAVSAWGGTDGSGILWLTAGDHDLDDVPGTLLALNAQDLTQSLWSSEMNPDRDRPGGFAKFATPTVANGLVFVPTFSNQVAVYGLVGTPPEASPRTGTSGSARSNKRKLY